MVLRQLQNLVAEHLPSLLAVCEAEGDPIPWVVERDFKLFLTCEEPAVGHAVLVCPSCGLRLTISFSCKRRSFCPCCIERRREDRTHHLLERVLPDRPYRHWVLTLPAALRRTLGYLPHLLVAVRALFIAAIFKYLLAKALRADPSLTPAMIHTGSISFNHPVSGNLDTNAHFHAVPFDGVLVERVRGGPIEFVPVSAPTDEEIANVAVAVCHSVCKLLTRHGMWKSDRDWFVVDGIHGRISLRKPQENGKRRWDEVTYFGRAVGTDEPALPRSGEPFDVFARDRVQQGDRKGLENLIRYLLSPPFKLDHLRIDEQGNVILRLKRARRDGTTYVRFTVHEFLRALTHLVTRPRTHAIGYHGVLARNARLRRLVVPLPTKRPNRDTRCVCEERSSHEQAAWKQLHTRAYRENFVRCPNCLDRLQLASLVGDRLDYQDSRWLSPDIPPKPAAEPATN